MNFNTFGDLDAVASGNRRLAPWGIYKVKERQTHQKLMTFLKYVLKEKMDIMKSQYSILLMTSSLKEELLQIVMDTNIKWPPIGNEFKL